MLQKLKQKIKKGSILGATLIILGIILVSALSFSLVSIQERKTSTGANKSSQALQIAGTGAEKVLQLIKNNIGGQLSSIDSNCDGTISSPDGYSVQLQDDAGDPVTGCSTAVSAVKKVKSVGTADQNQRAVEVAVADYSGNPNECDGLEIEDSDNAQATILDAVIDCRNSSGGNWQLPTAEELACFIGWSGVSTNFLWTRTPAYDSTITSPYRRIKLSDGETGTYGSSYPMRYRCVKYKW